MSLSHKINLNTASQFFGKALALIFTSANTLLLRRLWGREIYGEYIFIFALVMLLASLADFGTYLVAVKEASQNQRNQPKILGNMFWLRLLISSLTLILSWTFLRLFLRANPIFSLLLLSLPLMLLLVYKETLMVIFHSCLKLYWASLQTILTAFFSFLVALILFFQKGNLKTYLLLLLLVYFFVNLFFTLLAWRQTKISLVWDYRIIKKLIWQSLPLGAILLLFTVYSRIDTLILKFIWGSEMVGIYGLAYKIYETLVLPAAYLMNALLPILSRQVLQPSKNSAKFLLQKASALLVTASLLIAVFTFFLAPLIMELFTGMAALPEVSALRWLLPALPLAFLNHLTGYTIIALGEQRKTFNISALALAFNFLANLIFVPFFAFKACALITAMTEFLVLFLTFQVVAQKLNFRFNYLNWPRILSDFVKKRGKIFDEKL